MCMVSNIGDDFTKKWPQNPVNPWPEYMPNQLPHVALPQVSKFEFDALKKEVDALKKLLEAANKFDEETGQPHCHMDEKVAIIKKLAEVVGVDMNDVFK